ncbi:eukaryotic translation initiation factor [Cyclospora cayetanensis]|uniref:Eukaryotic translation initiation factor 3 subunit G n=1 Tax=Cyclospora cayetanensis TaxID=88456 RepID=A0A1D3D467_9EIME|nr:eukaryotic translation initiation factor [Cyclospora cayetanensis]
MTTDRKWADFELEDDGDLGDLAATPGGFETRPDSDGIKTVTNYIQNSKGETLKIIKRVKVTHVVHRINKAVHERRNIPFFGIEAIEGSNAKAFTVRSVEEIPLEVSKETLLRAKFKEDEDDEDIQFASLCCVGVDVQDLNPAKTSRDLRQKFLSLQNEDEPVDTAEADPLGSRLGVGAAKGFSRLRGGPGGDALKDLEARRREEATIRVTNLSEDAKEEDLTELFGTIGKLERVFLAKHNLADAVGKRKCHSTRAAKRASREAAGRGYTKQAAEKGVGKGRPEQTFTDDSLADKKASKGFAFITYANRELAAEAIRKLNRHGYDNLLLNVEWARPNNRER